MTILALACFATDARGQEPDVPPHYTFGSTCRPSQVAEEGRTQEPVCTPLTYAPIGSTFKRNFHENGHAIKWHRNKRADRLVPARPVSAEAAPK